jgi:antitoxin component of MazEF toxin-antitoxin module
MIMVSITTKLVKDGNSMAVRLPKTLLTMSGLRGSVQLEVKAGQIIIKQVKTQPRAGWKAQIEKVLKEEPDINADDFSDMNAADADGLDNLAAWNGPTYEEWLLRNAKK